MLTFLHSGDFKGKKFGVVGPYDSSACQKILLPCFPSLLIKGLCIGKQQTSRAIGFSTVYICYPSPEENYNPRKEKKRKNEKKVDCEEMVVVSLKTK